nr:TonB-dependent receptor [Chitinophagales bacterium]
MKYFQFLLFAVFIIFYNSIYAQISIQGTINDKATKESLPGVSIYISDLKTGSVTDINGKYSINNIKPGAYLIEVSYVGYKRIVNRYQITGDTILNFILEESPTELNQIVVTAVTHSTELKLSPVIIKPVDITELNQNSSTNLIDALKNIPGINQITTGVGISKPTIRGLGYNRVITLYHGIRQEGQQWGDEHGIEIDEYAIDRIEIVKGPGSLLY